VHRAGRLAQAGQAGHALLFLLLLERQYVEVLELRSLRDISPLSLSSTLLAAAAVLCRGLTQEGESRASTGSYTFSGGGAEAYTYAIQNRLEECVVQDNASYRASIKKKFNGDPKRRRMQKRKDAVGGPLCIATTMLLSLESASTLSEEDDSASSGSSHTLVVVLFVVFVVLSYDCLRRTRCTWLPLVPPSLRCLHPSAPTPRS
jgi:hypothetical protein